MKKYIAILALIFIQGCSSSSEDPAPTPIAKVLFVNNGDGDIVGVMGESSVGTKELFVLTSTDANDATQNIIEKGEVGVIEITKCNVLWDLSYSVSISDDPLDNIIQAIGMQMYSCDTEYELTCVTLTFEYLGQPITLTQCML